MSWIFKYRLWETRPTDQALCFHARDGFHIRQSGTVDARSTASELFVISKTSAAGLEAVLDVDALYDGP